MTINSKTLIHLGGLALLLAAPSRGASVPAGVFVVNTKSASVSLIDLKTNTEVRKIPVGSTPYGVALVQDGTTLAVGVEGEEKVKFYDTKAFKLKGETKVGKMHNDHIILTEDGKYLMVANFFSDDVLGIDVNSRKIAFRLKGLSAPHVVKYGPLNNRAFVTCKKVTGIGIIDPKTRKVLKNYELNVNPRSLTFSPDESKIYFGSFWVDGIFEMETESGKVTRLIGAPPPSENAVPQEVTYHGVEAVGSKILAANEGRSYVDVFDMGTGKQLDRFTEVSKPCCIEKIPGHNTDPERVLISNIGDGTMTLAEVSQEGKLKKLARIAVGNAPKRVVFTDNLIATMSPSE